MAQANSAVPAAGVLAPPPGVSKIVVAIHGVGKQFRCDTIREVASRFGDGSVEAIPMMPLGHFSLAEGSAVRWSVLDTTDPQLQKIGFAEVYWADIPHALVQMADTLEETKAWAGTIVSRAETIYQRQLGANSKLKHADFAQGIDAIDTLVDGIAVIERLCLMADKVLPIDGKLEVASLLRDYVGDVQTVTEFPHYRGKILYRFHAMLNGIVDAFHAQHPSAPQHHPEIYIVAHSEGTVISLLALLQGLWSTELADPDRQGPVQVGAWVSHVKGLMTLGSPIDKHVALWPGLWESFRFDTLVLDDRIEVRREDNPGKSMTLRHRIKWRNYFDFGDPIGFHLDEVRRTLRQNGCDAFEFDALDHDIGYSRYWFPGKAHVDYWKDAELFRHFIDTVVRGVPVEEAPPPPPSSRLRGLVATLIPYAASWAVHYLALFALFMGLAGMERADLGRCALDAFMPSIVLYLLTYAARVPSLVRQETRWRVLVLVCLLAVAGSTLLLADHVAAALGTRLAFLDPFGIDEAARARLALIAAVALVMGLAWSAKRYRSVRGHRVLVGAGALACLLLALNDRGGPDLAALGGSIAFLYLWRLGMIVFDLAFVWHRYIRNGVSVRTLRDWRLERDAQVGEWWGLKDRPRTRHGDGPGPASGDEVRKAA